MTRYRSGVVALAVIALAAAARVARIQDSSDPPLVPGSDRVVVDVPVAATPAPPPWMGSVIAAVVPVASGQAVAVYEIGTEAPGRELVSGFDEISGPDWSPDGQELAFAGLRDANWDVYVVARDGTGLRRVTEHPAYDAWPTWSPDGRQIAFASYHDGRYQLFRASAIGASPQEPVGLTAEGGPAIEPAWSPDGEWIVFAAWHDAAYRLEAIAATGGDRLAIVDSAAGADLRAPAWSPDGRQISYMEQRHGSGELVVRPWRAPSDAGHAGDPVATGLEAQVRAYSWYPGGGALAVVTDERDGRALDVRDASGYGRARVAMLPSGAGDVSWARGSTPTTLPKLASTAPRAGSWPQEAGARAYAEPRPGLAVLDDVRVPGARIHAGLAGDFAAMRDEVRIAVGADYLGTLSDLWRPLGYNGSSFFSWHKTGRAFDTQMEFRGPGGRRDMVLVREEIRGRTYWRMFLRAGAQDGTVGRPLVEPGWTFAAGSGEPALAAEGGRRGSSLPEGYWLDFTALADRHGWRRIPSNERRDLDWRRNWSAIEYWHYERRDGLRWFEAVRQVYGDDELEAELHAERLRARGIPLGRLSWLGFPSRWLSEG